VVGDGKIESAAQFFLKAGYLIFCGKSCFKASSECPIGDGCTMDFHQLWQDYKELVLVIATAVATLIAQKVLPGLRSMALETFDKTARVFCLCFLQRSFDILNH
jgi:hypothetical protein